jgi:hypothetical protein
LLLGGAARPDRTQGRAHRQRDEQRRHLPLAVPLGVRNLEGRGHQADRERRRRDEEARRQALLDQPRRLSGRYFSVYDDIDELIGRAASIRRNDLYTLRLRE